MKDFFNAIKVRDFIAILNAVPGLEAEEVGLDQAGLRFLAEDILSPEDLPAFSRSSMDGYAVRSRDTFGATESNPAYLELQGEISIAHIHKEQIEPGNCLGIVTGAALPPGTDSVVMVEHAQEMGQGTVEIRRPVAPWENVMLRGEDVGKGDLVLKAGTRITARRLGILAALGIDRVKVSRLPRVGIVSTGDEIVEVSAKPGPGYIRDVNSHTLGQMIREEGCELNVYGIVPDDEQRLKYVLNKALEENNIVLVSGGSSVGKRDYTTTSMSGIEGLEILVHGLAISPGKPTIFARKGNKSVWGLPGQVTSAQVVMLILVLPFLRHMQGDSECFDQEREFIVPATLSRNIASRYGREDYVRVRLRHDNSSLVCDPVTGKSGLLKTLLDAHGLIKIPDNCEGLAQDEEVLVRLF